MTQTLKFETRNIRHDFNKDEIAGIHTQFHQAIKEVGVIESEADSVKANFKARTAEAQAKADRFGSLIDAGFEMRMTDCIVVFRPKDRKKDYYLKSCLVDGKLPKKAKIVLTDDMTEDDMQAELFSSEGKFERREEIQLFTATEHDNGILVVGRMNGKWFTALRAEIGGSKIEQRLDSEQPCCKHRYDAICKATKRFDKWVTESLGEEVAKGFKESLYQLCEAHKEREE